MKRISLAEYYELPHAYRTALRRHAFQNPGPICDSRTLEPLPEHLKDYDVQHINKLLTKENSKEGWFPKSITGKRLWPLGRKAPNRFERAPDPITGLTVRVWPIRSAEEAQAAFNAMGTNQMAALSLYSYCLKGAVWEVSRVFLKAFGKTHPGCLDTRNGTEGLVESPEWPQVEEISKALTDRFLLGSRNHKASEEQGKTVMRAPIAVKVRADSGHFLNFWTTYLKNEIKDIKFREPMGGTALPLHVLELQDDGVQLENKTIKRTEEQLYRMEALNPALIYAEKREREVILDNLNDYRLQRVVELFDAGYSYEEVRERLCISQQTLTKMMRTIKALEEQRKAGQE